ncbi:MAG: TonB-dependent receptor [Ignavibacteriaceae bacterium]
MKFFQIVFFLGTFLLSSALSISQTSVVQKTDSTGIYRLTDIVISATKTNTNTLELANSISIIDSAEIANRNAFNLFDLLKNEYSLSTTTQGGPGTLSNVYLRGGSASYTHVLIDGVEMNLTSDPNGVYDFAALSPDNIDRIEILRGPQSILYGSDAMSGVINIITRKGSGSPGFSLSAEGGSYNTYKLNAGLTGNINNFNYSIAAGRVKSGGFSAANEKYGNNEKDGFERDNISTAVGYKFTEYLKTNFILRFLDSKADYDQSGIYGDDPTYKFDQEEFSIRNETEINLLNKFWNQKFGASLIRNIRIYKYDVTVNNPTASTSLYDGRKIKIDWQNNLNVNKNNLLSMGVDFEIDEAVSEFKSSSELGNYVSLFPKRDSRTIGLYLQHQLRVNEEFFISAGVRIDDHDKFGSSFTYRIAPSYIIWQTGTKLKATVGTGFKTPSLFYLYDPAFGNPDLQPEKNLGLDAGIEQFLWNEGISFGITYFQNSFKKLFGFDNNFRTININRAETKGLEIYSTIKPFFGLDAKLNYTYTDAIDKSAGLQAEERKLVRRPEHKMGSYLSYNFSESTNANVEIIYVGKRDDIDFNNLGSTRIQLDPYVLLNLAAHYRLFDFLRLNIRVENLLDSDYEEVFGYGTPGLSFYSGIILNFN